MPRPGASAMVADSISSSLLSSTTRIVAFASKADASASSGSRNIESPKRSRNVRACGTSGPSPKSRTKAFSLARLIPSERITWQVVRKMLPLSMPPEKHTPIGSYGGITCSHCAISSANASIYNLPITSRSAGKVPDAGVKNRVYTGLGSGQPTCCSSTT
jgi:hypothetical protein